MKIYRVSLCLKLAISRLKSFYLFEYNSENPTVFVEAADPDDACYKAVHNLATIVFKQNGSQETIELFNDVKYDIRVTKVVTPNEKKL